jgi:hypothetical protein
VTYEVLETEDQQVKDQLYKEMLEGLREIDRREMEGLGVSVRSGLEQSIYDTDVVHYARVKETGKLILCYGIQHFLVVGGKYHIIWCLGTEEMKRFGKSFVKESEKVIRQWVDDYGTLLNTVATFNKEAIAWLKWLGAEFSPPRTISGVEFVDFVIRKKEE